MEWAMDIKFDWRIIDESTVMSEGQFVQLWRECDLVILVGDQQQLGRPSMSKATQRISARLEATLRSNPNIRWSGV